MQNTINLPTLSVVVPNYNHAQYLPECLESLLQQSLRPVEIIVIDDCSTDNSLAVLGEFSQKNPRISFCRNEKNMGVVFTLNRGLAMVRGEYVVFPGADDRVLPGYFETAMQVLANHPEAGLCFSDPSSFDHVTGKVSENRLHLSEGPAFFSPDELVKLARRKRLLIPGNCIFKRPAFQNIGGYIRDLKWHSDFFPAYVIALRHGACYVPEPLTQWRVMPQSYMTAGLRKWGAQQEVVSRILELLHSPAYQDVLPWFKKSGAMAFAPRATLAILAHRRYWSFLNPVMLRRALPMDVFWCLPHGVQTILRRLLGK